VFEFLGVQLDIVNEDARRQSDIDVPIPHASAAVSSHLSGGSLVREFFFYRVRVRVRVRVSRVSRVGRVSRV